jgi:formylglycine-generating enzyme required for sulfatase activity
VSRVRPLSLAGLLLALAAAWSAPGAAQLSSIRAGVVKILVTSPVSKTGAGIVVRHDADEAYLITAAHVVAGADTISVEFPGVGRSWKAEARNIEFDNPTQGLALLQVTGTLPSDVVALPLATDIALYGGEQVTIIGHQPSTGDWGVLTGTVSGRKGRELVIQAPIQEQTSGGPVIVDGRVVGLVQSRDPSGQFGYAVTAQAIREYMAGNRVSLLPGPSAPPPAAPEKALPATPTPERQEPRPAASAAPPPAAPPPAAPTAPPPPAPPPAAPTAPPPPAKPSEPAASAGKAFRDCAECPEMVVLPEGAFTIGSPPGQGPDVERPQHRVTIARPFAVGKYEVTFDQWDACVTAGGCKHSPGNRGKGGGDEPVINVNWNDAQAYVSWLAKKTGKPYRLLSEAEWEYAARAGTTTRYPWGDEPGANRGNFLDSGSPWSGKQTAPVGSFAPNQFGLHDVIGNADEWVQDCWNDSYQGAPADGRARDSDDCGRRVLRGGSWYSRPEAARVSHRDGVDAGNRFGSRGFRVARTL